MAKIKLSTIASTTDVSSINANFKKIETELDQKVLYRNNTSKETNSLLNDIDANGKQIYNLPKPTLAHQAARLGDIQYVLSMAEDAAEASVAAVAAAEIATVASGTAVNAANEALGAVGGVVNDVAMALSISGEARSLAQEIAADVANVEDGISDVQTSVNTLSNEAARKSELSSANGGLGVGLSHGTWDVPTNVSAFFKTAPVLLTAAIDGAIDRTGATDYSVEIQKVLNQALVRGGMDILFPPKTKLKASMLDFYSGTNLYAADWTSEIIVPEDSNFRYGLSINRGTGGSADPETNVKNVRWAGFLTRNENPNPVFREFCYLWNINAASWFTAEDCALIGPQGDAIYLGSSNVNNVERHNENILLKRLYCDGINKQNRNFLSILDGVNVDIHDLFVKRMCKPDMPGVIDVEPNAQAFSRLKNIFIDKFLFQDCGSTGVAFLLPSNDVLTQPARNFKVSNGTIKNCATGLTQATNVVTGAAPHNFIWENIVIEDCETPFRLGSIRGGTFNNIDCYRGKKQAFIGSTFNTYDLTFNNLRMYECGQTETNGLTISNVDGFRLNYALFVDCGRTDVVSGRAIYFTAGAGRDIHFNGVQVQSPLGRTNVNADVSGTYTLDNGSCTERNSSWLPGITQKFIVDGTTLVFPQTAPTTGTWKLGNKVLRPPVDGLPSGYVWVGANGTPTASSWAIIDLVGGPQIGATASRPTAATLGLPTGASYQVAYKDTTLAAAGKPIWHRGTDSGQWVDALGAVV